MKSPEELRKLDMRHFWHPYTDIASNEETDFPIIDRGSGVRLRDVEGRWLLDGISSWWCVNLGHSNPNLVRAIEEQTSRLQHSITGGMSHVQIIELSSLLASIAPAGLSRVYYASDGACSVEAAVRIALQYWWNVGRPEKSGLISLEGGYHGDTMGCAGLGYIDRFHRSIAHVLNRSIQAPSPHCFHCKRDSGYPECGLECFDAMRELIEENASHTAAVVVEPVCQGAAGMRIYPPEYVARLRQVCSDNDVLLILDEIAVGFMRTGRMFASDLAGIVPDLMCVGKGLTGGTLPMSAVLVRDSVHRSFRNDPQSLSEPDRTFHHGHTFCGNPIAAAAARAALSGYRDHQLQSNVAMLSDMLSEGFEDFGSIPGIRGAKALGCMSSLEIDEERGGAAAAARAAREARRRGLLIRPLGPVLYLWPPLVTTGSEMSEMLGIFGESLSTSLS